ncbi:hypothetical protein TMatcc_008247 [Talaromyces marneffei ATCC 18224]|uniref:uncharacterized protein n=1 Tax=Talaromyces marneffei TaxID=37727 RepID=UPI0012A79CA9|nr:uncharacterized protein EYB26_007600 [Talaromyces marneffei]QGA19905.1 hypothetical protein EYB26_007600 [Talaromyces marneffei]
MASTNEYKFQTVVTITLTDEERDNQTINEGHAGAAVAAMYRDGIVVLENAVNVEHVDNLNQILTSEAEALAALPTTHLNNNSKGAGKTGNMSQAPPVTNELMYEDIWANGPASSVIASNLGPTPHVTYVNRNTNLRGFGAIGAIGFALSAEVGSLPLRPVTQSIVGVTQGVTGWVMGFVTPYIINPDEGNLGAKIGFVFFGLGIIASVLVFLYIPETKGLNFDEIDCLVSSGTNSRKFQGAIAEYRAHGQSVNKEDLGQKLTSYENEKDGVVIEQQE